MAGAQQGWKRRSADGRKTPRRQRTKPLPPWIYFVEVGFCSGIEGRVGEIDVFLSQPLLGQAKPLAEASNLSNGRSALEL